MHILFLTDNFPPEVNAPASRTHEHCREWVRAGHQVTVITCAPNFPQGKVYEGYRNRLWQSETIDGIRVVRVWTYITANKGFVKRILDYQSFMVSGTLASLFVRKVDVIVGTSPQLFTACAAWAVSRLKRVPYVFELRDLWPESIKAVGAMKESPVIRALERLELFLYRKASAVVSVTQAFKRNLISRGIEEAKIHVVTNGVDLSRFTPMPRDAVLEQSLGLQGKLVAGYIGTHGLAHGLDTLLDAAALLQKSDLQDRFRILFLGNGATKQALLERANSMGLRNVLFIDSVPKNDVVRYWSLLDVSIIHLRKTDLFSSVIPSKLFESMGMGIPVLLGVRGEAADILKRVDAGACFEPENAVELSKHIQALVDSKTLHERYSRAGASKANLFDRAQLANDMRCVLERVADRMPGTITPMDRAAAK